MHSGEDLAQCGLARSVGADQRVDLTSTYLDTDIIKSKRPCKTFGDA
jgi:hypothetical protein